MDPKTASSINKISTDLAKAINQNFINLLPHLMKDFGQENTFHVFTNALCKIEALFLTSSWVRQGLVDKGPEEVCFDLMQIKIQLIREIKTDMKRAAKEKDIAAEASIAALLERLFNDPK